MSILTLTMTYEIHMSSKNYMYEANGYVQSLDLPIMLH